MIGAALAVTATAGVLYLKPEALNRTEPLIPATYHYLTGTYSATYDFVTPSHGWALVTDYGGAFAEFFIFQTIDGAAHWRRQYSAEARQGGPYLHFADERNGILVYSGGTYTSVDGGDHWLSVRLPGRGFCVAVTSQNDAWAQIFDLDGPHLYRTSDGGKTWTRNGADPPGSALVVAMDDVMHSAAFGKNGEGWLGAQDETQAVVFHTLDGGASWQRIEVWFGYGPGSNSRPYSTSVELLGDSTVVVFVTGDMGVSATMMSVDHGATWYEMSFPRDGANPSDATFLDANHVWYFQEGFVYITDDGGRSWRNVIDPEFPTGWHLKTARAIDPKHAWWVLVSSSNSEVGALAMTSDGGRNWRLVNAPQP